MPKAKTTVSKNSTSSDKVINQVVEVIEFMGENKLAEIELETADMKMTLKKHSVAAPVIAAPHPTQASYATPQLHAMELAPSVKGKPVEEKVEVVENDFHKINSPMAGTFYRAPSPTSGPFVNEGDNVTVGQTVCIVEAMKMMNEIKADKAGKIVKILMENGQSVDKGANLFYIGE